jgi:hypothetical protein
MPRSVFVLERRTPSDEPGLTHPLPLHQLPTKAHLAIAARELGRPLTSDETNAITNWSNRGATNPGQLLRLALYLKIAANQGKRPDPVDAEFDSLVNLTLIDNLSSSARAAIDVLAGFGTTEWGVDLLASVAGVADPDDIAQLLRGPLASCDDGHRYRLPATVLHDARRRSIVDSTDVARRIAVWVRSQDTPDVVAVEVAAIDAALAAAFRAGDAETALDLALVAAIQLLDSCRWSALVRVAR